jgi:iron complex transport system substrate-binding protein
VSKVRFKLYPIYLFGIFLIFAAEGCVEENPIKKPQDKSETVYSQYLKIQEEKSGVLIQLIHPDRKNKTYNYFIRRDKNSKTPDGYIAIDKENMNFVVFSTTHIGMLDKLNQLDKIKGTCSKNLIFNEQICQRIVEKKVVDFGDETSPSIEKLISIKPKAIIYSGFSAEFSKSNELHKLGVLTIPNFDWKESHPLGKAEWILFFGYLTGTENLAKSHLEKVKKEYLEIQKIASKTEFSPSVIMGSKIGDFWYGPAGESYGSKLLKDANSNYIYSKTPGKGSVEYSLEKVYSDAQNAEFWINPGFPKYELLKMNNSKAEYFKAFENKKVFCYTNNPNKYWEMSGVQPNWILSDLIQIFHPELKIDKPLYFYKALE